MLNLNVADHHGKTRTTVECRRPSTDVNEETDEKSMTDDCLLISSLTLSESLLTMSSGTEREETRKIAYRCAVSRGQCPCSHVITCTECHVKCRYRTDPSPNVWMYSPDLPPQWLPICFQYWRNSWMDGNLSRWGSTLHICIIHTASGWLEDQDQ